MCGHPNSRARFSAHVKNIESSACWCFVFAQIAAFLIDMDGVLYKGQRPIQGATAFLKRLQDKEIPYQLLTNHSCMTPGEFSLKLRRMGIAVPRERIYSSSLAVAEWLRRRGVRRVYAIGERGLHRALVEQKIAVAQSDVSHVVVGLSRSIRYEQLTRAMRLIQSGAEFIGTNPDPAYPVEDGLAPECGALLAALETCTGCSPKVIGKPAPFIYRCAAKRLKTPLRKIAMIGDRLDTDILGAHRAGMRSILVLTGCTTKAMLKHSRIKPDAVVNSLAEIKP